MFSTSSRLLAVSVAITITLSGSAVAADARTYLFDGGDQKLNYKPRSYAAGGVGASARMENIRWSSWGSRKAFGRGTAANNDCDPSCAEGSVIREPGTLTLTKPKTCRTTTGKRYRYFSRLKYTFRGRSVIFPAYAQYSCHR